MLEAELQIAETVVREAGELVRSYFGSNQVAARAKGPRDLVTAADTASEALIVGRLRDAFPDDAVVGEEGSRRESGGSRRWFLDPLDGTLNFAYQIPIWCVSLCLFDGDQPVLGATYDPIRGELFSAASGLGARCNGETISSRDLKVLSQAMVHLTVDFNDQSMLDGMDDLQVVAPRVLRTRNIGSAALALAYVAAGRFDAMVHRRAHTWDYGAGAVLIREAGGIVTEIDGTQFDDESVTMLATASPQIHGSLIELLRREK